MKQQLKAWTARLARTRVVRSAIGHLVYPTIVDWLRHEVQPDITSPSGVVEALARKTHAYLVLNEELAPTGQDCGKGLERDEQTRAKLIDVALVYAAQTPGAILEFGVYKGESLLRLAQRCPDRQVFGFDSFDGLPENWWRFPKGHLKTAMPCLARPNVTLVKGLFEQTLPGFLSTWPGQAAFVNVDCVLYESTQACLLPLLPRCQVGTVILFDEYYNYPDFARHEWLAWREIRARFGIAARCIAFDRRRAAFQITSLGALAGNGAPAPQ